MTVRRVEFEAPLTPSSRVALSDGTTATVADVQALAPARRIELVPDAVLRGQIERLAEGTLVLPGADRWRHRVALASPANPVWVPALERNARVVELGLARDALADPWNPTRVLRAGEDDELTVLGATSQNWRKGDIAFDVQLLQPSTDGGIPTFATLTYCLSERDRRHLWLHLTGLLDAMAIQRGQVAESDGQRNGPWEPGHIPYATVGMVGLGVPASYAFGGVLAQTSVVREDGQFRRDQQIRTAVAEAHASLLRRRATTASVPVVYALPPLSDYEAAGGSDDLAQSVRRSGRVLLGVAVGGAATVGGVAAARSETARAWLSGRWRSLKSLGDGL